MILLSLLKLFSSYKEPLLCCVLYQAVACDDVVCAKTYSSPTVPVPETFGYALLKNSPRELETYDDDSKYIYFSNPSKLFFNSSIDDKANLTSAVDPLTPL